MIKINFLSPHDAMPGGPDRNVVVLRRFEEDNPDRTTVQIILTGTPEETAHPRNPDGTVMHLDKAIEAAQRVAQSEGLHEVFVIDRIGGVREQDILRHDGDHSVNMTRLTDTDEEDGVRGSDMRDIAHPVHTT